MKKIWIVSLIIVIVLSSAIIGFAISIFAVNIDTSHDPYTDYAATVVDKRGKLLTNDFVKTVDASDINGLFPELDEGEGDISSLPEYDIDLYRITYTSVFLEEIVTLSGLVVIPQKQGKLSHVQYHHYTLFPYDCGNGESNLDAPSLYDGEYPETQYLQYESRLFGNYLGSHGYLVSLPDYIGYGVSDSYEHSYSVNDRLAEQSVDMILATRELCSKLNVEINDKLFFCGWSEGAAAALATQKLIESDYKDTLTVTASAPLAGFYNTEFYGKVFINLAPFIPIDFGSEFNDLIWAAYAINQYTDDKPLDNSDIFKFEVNNQLDVTRDRPTNVLSGMFRYFIDGKDRLFSKFAQNELAHDWTPIAPVYIHHGTNDGTVPFTLNADLTVNNFNNQGGTAELVKYDGHDHESLDKLYLLNIIEEFGQY